MYHISQLISALKPLAAIADAYDENGLDEHRPEWQDNPRLATIPNLDEIELFSGRGGKELLTLGHCFEARKALKEAEASQRAEYDAEIG